MEEATCDLMIYFSSKTLDIFPNYPVNPSQTTSSHLNNSFYNCFPGIFYDILSGLEEVHDSHQLAHNDVKPENMLFFSSSSTAKLCDFEYCS